MAVKRFHAELAVAAGTGIMGVIAVVGAVQLGHRWGEYGPQSGYFPFYIGLILIGASLWNMGTAIIGYRSVQPRDQLTDGMHEPFLSRESTERLARFLAVMFAFLIITLTLGIYIGSTAYIAWSAWRGGYRPLLALALGAGFAVAMYVIFEVAFKMPLLKGPIEPLLGIY